MKFAFFTCNFQAIFSMKRVIWEFSLTFTVLWKQSRIGYLFSLFDAGSGNAKGLHNENIDFEIELNVL